MLKNPMLVSMIGIMCIKYVLAKLAGHSFSNLSITSIETKGNQVPITSKNNFEKVVRNLCLRTTAEICIGHQIFCTPRVSSCDVVQNTCMLITNWCGLHSQLSYSCISYIFFCWIFGHKVLQPTKCDPYIFFHISWQTHNLRGGILKNWGMKLHKFGMSIPKVRALRLCPPHWILPIFYEKLFALAPLIFREGTSKSSSKFPMCHLTYEH